MPTATMFFWIWRWVKGWISTAWVVERRWYAPHVVFLMVGGNDLTNPNLSALDVASSIHDLAKHLIDSEGCYMVFVASITGRTSYPYLNPSYPQKVGDCNQYLRVLFESEENMFYRTLRGLYNPSTEVMLHDGIHLNDWGHYRLYRTITQRAQNHWLNV